MSKKPDDKRPRDSALSEVPGVEPPPSISREQAEGYRSRRRGPLTVDEYLDGILAGDRVVLGRAITLVESQQPAHQEAARAVIEGCQPRAGRSLRVGITGIPGVGKSSFIETLGLRLAGEGRRIAVLAVDPTSETTKGSILGDKTRMAALAVHERAFIRPSPSGGTLGGVARKTREAVILCEAAGFDTIVIETVGVGQSETAVRSMVDFFLLLMIAGAGDDLQGIKRGIMELADLVAITKADGDNLPRALAARAEFEMALHLFPPTVTGWRPRVVTCSAVTGEGIGALWRLVGEHEQLMKDGGHFERRRREQARYWMHQAIDDALKERFLGSATVKKLMPELERAVLEGRLSPFAAARRLLETQD